MQYEKNLFPKGSYGPLTAKPGSVYRIVYSFDKVTLTKDQVLKVYLYETDGQRNLVMTLSARDINKAMGTAIKLSHCLCIIYVLLQLIEVASSYLLPLFGPSLFVHSQYCP